MVSFCRLKVTFQGGLVEKRFVPAPSGAGELPRIWSTIMTQHAAFYWKQTNYWKKINKKNRITNHKNTNRKKNRKDQIAPERFVFVSFLFLCFYFSRETPESQICIFSLEKIEQQTKRNNKETNCGRVLCIFVFCFCLVSTLSQLASFWLFFVLLCFFFSKERCRFGIPESPEGKKQKRNEKEAKKKQIQSSLAPFVSFLFLQFVFESLRDENRSQPENRIDRKGAGLQYLAQPKLFGPTKADWGQTWPSLVLSWAEQDRTWAQLGHNLRRTRASWLQLIGPNLSPTGVQDGATWGFFSGLFIFLS